MAADEFARRLKRAEGEPDTRYALFLGAGCSVSSGIPAARELVVDDWLPRLHYLTALEASDVTAWACSTFPGYAPESASAYYGDIIQRLFLHPQERQREIERLCDSKFPGFGYATLARLVASPGGQFIIVLTTNFDDLLADALYLFTPARPLVIHHESLATYIRPTRTRPLIVKLHGDHRLAPHNTQQETQQLKDEVESRVRALLTDRGLVIMGYGGNDEGIASMLEKLPEDAVPLGIYWVSGSRPAGRLRDWLEERNAVWVEKGDFDEFMLLIHDAFGFSHPTADRFEEVFKGYQQTYETLSSRIARQPDSAPGVSLMKEVVDRTDRTFAGWTSVAAAASEAAGYDPDLAARYFSEGLKRFPTSVGLRQRYAEFLWDIGDREGAEREFRAALTLDPDSASILAKFAEFVATGDAPEEAEQYYLMALDKARDVGVIVSYAEWLANSNRHVEAETQFRRAVHVNPDSSYPLSRYGHFLVAQARFTEAEATYAQALEKDPNNAFVLNFYANLLRKLRKLEEAERLYNRAIQVHPPYGWAFYDYAEFLMVEREDVARAKHLLANMESFTSADAPVRASVEALKRRIHHLEGDAGNPRRSRPRKNRTP